MLGGVVLLYYGLDNPRDQGYNEGNIERGSGESLVRYPVTFPRNISNCSKTQEHIQKLTSLGIDGRRYYI
jgi:hypothetical protein